MNCKITNEPLAWKYSIEPSVIQQQMSRWPTISLQLTGVISLSSKSLIFRSCSLHWKYNLSYGSGISNKNMYSKLEIVIVAKYDHFSKAATTTVLLVFSFISLLMTKIQCRNLIIIINSNCIKFLLAIFFLN